MASVCTGVNFGTTYTPAAFNSTNGSFLVNSLFTAAPIFLQDQRSPSTTGTPNSAALPLTVPYTIGTTNYTATLFSVTNLVAQVISNRYTVPSGAYWGAATQSRSLTTLGQKDTIYTSYLLDKDVPNAVPATKIISSTSTLQTALTGSVDTKKVSVSYDLLYSLKYEFCFYLSVYKILLSDYITLQNTAISTTYTQDMKNAEIMKVVNNLSATRLRLNDIIEIASYIGTKQTAEMSGMSANINQFLQSTSETVTALDANASVLRNNNKDANLRMRQLDYSEEKNAYANQLLAMYGFANLIALGLLFYIYKS